MRTVRAEIEKGIGLAKCQKCGCMRETLDNVAASLSGIEAAEAQPLRDSMAAWNLQLQPTQYACLGCVYCYPAVAQNAFTTAFPDNAPASGLVCDFRIGPSWPFVVGEYQVLDLAGHVAVSTLGSITLAQQLAEAKPQGLVIVGKTETENIGIDKIIKNIITNPRIQYLIVAGKETEGHLSGQTLLALAANGVDMHNRVIGSPSTRPVLRNVSAAAVEAFRAQVQVIDLVGCEDPDEIRARIEALSPQAPEPCG